MKSTIAAAVLMFIFGISLNPNQGSEIVWDDLKEIEWSDFVGRPDKNSPFKAKTMCEIRSDIKGEGGEMSLKIQGLFLKKLSWVKEKSDALLYHERGHFNLCELWARKLRFKIRDRTFDKGTFQDSLNSFQKEVNEGNRKMQEMYDNESAHGIIEGQQKMWTDKIRRSLIELSAYTQPVVFCKIQ